jgi:hypothetical protein
VGLNTSSVPLHHTLLSTFCLSLSLSLSRTHRLESRGSGSQHIFGPFAPHASVYILPPSLSLSLGHTDFRAEAVGLNTSSVPLHHMLLSIFCLSLSLSDTQTREQRQWVSTHLRSLCTACFCLYSAASRNYERMDLSYSTVSMIPLKYRRNIVTKTINQKYITKITL